MINHLLRTYDHLCSECAADSSDLPGELSMPCRPTSSAAPQDSQPSEMSCALYSM